MEENKKEEVKQEETQVEDTQTKALLEPSPYKRKATDDTATVSEDTSSEEEATPDEERPVNAEEKVFKKRYDDLKRHYDSTVNKHKDDVSKLKRQLEDSAEQVLPKTKEEIEAWRAKYPDVYDVIETIAHTKADEKAKKIQTELKELESQQAVVQRDKAEVELAKLHPDYHDIRGDEKFHQWVSEQDSVIQGWLYENTSNAKLAARAIDLYKVDTGNKKKKANNSLEASKSVTSTSKREIDTTNKKTWKVSDIAKMKPAEFAKYEKDIDLARVEGRIVNA
jgi:small-conductance mechanosensitive channel